MRWKELVAGAALATALFSAYEFGRARADGIPTAQPLFFSGNVDLGGSPLSGSHSATVELWDMAVGGTRVCSSGAVSTTFTAGEFRVPLGADCVTAIQQNPNLWADIQVDTTHFSQRMKLGAVPYAVEAARANGLTVAATRAVVPAGTVVAFAGPVERVPSGWLLCDGRGVPRSMYPALFDAIGTGHGGSGADFNLPDYRGRFLRGVDYNQNRDPDRGSRTAMNPNGNTGDAVGTLQDSSTALPRTAFSADRAGTHAHTQVAHSHRPGSGGVGFLTQAGGPGILQSGSGYGTQTDTDSQTPVINPGGDHLHAITGGDRETRPVNAAVNYIIKT